MPGAAIGKVLNLGYAGNVSRQADAIITQRPAKGDPISFGDPVILNPDNSYTKFGATNIAAQFAGIAVREVKQATDYYPTGGNYKNSEPCDVISRGTVTVICNVGAPTAGGSVYLRIAENEAIPNGVIGGFEAAADGINTIELTNVKFTTGDIDTNKIAEVTMLTRLQP